MPQYAALNYSADVDWTRPEYAAEMAEYGAFGGMHGDAIRGGAALYPTSTATTVRVQGARGGDVVLSDGPYAETKEALTGFYLIEAADLDMALKIAADIPAAWGGAVEVRPVIDFGG
ncbi:transcription initiation protein [Mycobacterium antarcticum]|uniref:YciI family protein n=1 Tax=unclassified Mycolicibacterium TaxID=2636767 RepID=UPI0023A723BC|nr:MULTISPECIES: YciI family protein [unclassified Mycolicibacterium]BDX34401.1 transcription initiation protein [Mycolicibacterium sp. TUM20985]GLP77608.1 transcription initiation protein [Mycolicibacterium sp. TUM20983]